MKINRFAGWMLPLFVWLAPLYADRYDWVEFAHTAQSSLVSPPPAGVTANSTGLLRLHLRYDRNNQLAEAGVYLSVTVGSAGLTPTIQSLRIQEGRSGQIGPVVLDLPFTNQPSRALPNGRDLLASSVSVTDPTALAALRRLMAAPDTFYVLVASTAYPAGIVRGQFRSIRDVVLGGPLRASDVVPMVNGGATGEVALRIRDFGDSAIIDVNYDAKFPSAVRIKDIHVYRGIRGQAGSLALTLDSSGPFPTDSDGSYYLQGVPVEFVQSGHLDVIRRILASPEDFYIQLSTVETPGGALRGQLRPTEIVQFNTDLITANTVPLVQGIVASGVSRLRFYVTRSSTGAIESAAPLLSAMLYFPTAQNRLGVRIHEGVAGATGAAVLYPGIVRSATLPPPRFFDTNNYGNPYTFGPGTPKEQATIQAMLANPERFYVNVASTEFPNGFLRGQLAESTVPPPAVAEGGIINAAGNTATAAASAASLISVFGSRLASVTAVVPLNAAGQVPEEFGGASVTIGGAAAKLLFVSPNQLNIQVPDVVAGRHALRVRGPGGVSADREVVIGESSPGIFVITKADYSVVSAENPIAPNEAIILWTTGLGRANPPAVPGVRAPASPLSIPPIPTVLFDEVPAAVVAVAVAPGFVGVEQVVVQGGAGQSGAVTVRVRTGAGTSNGQVVQIQP